MSIWTYSSVPEDEYPYEIGKCVGRIRTGTERGKAIVDLWSRVDCPYCRSPLVELPDAKGPEGKVWCRWDGNDEDIFVPHVCVCANCGWWKAKIEKERDHGEGDSESWWYQGGASLKELDLYNIDAPAQEIQQYLTKHVGDSAVTDPNVLKATVVDVFRPLGFNALASAYTIDGGIEVVMQNDQNTVGVHVTHSQDSIRVEQIRSLGGALVVQGFTQGMFITTAIVRPGELRFEKTSAHLQPPRQPSYRNFDYRIELLDAKRFYEELSISQRPLYASFLDWVEVIDLDDLPCTLYLDDT